MTPLLRIVDRIPEGFLAARASDLLSLLQQPTLFHLPGRRAEPLFVSLLLHGNEDVGLKALQHVLRSHGAGELPRSVSFFVGNVLAAREGVRRLDAQPDYNRVWPSAETDGTPEHAMMRQIVEEMRTRHVFASIDLHNNTGKNPHYACVNHVDDSSLQLASLFSRTVVYFQRPKGVQAMAFAPLCPAVTCECGKVGDASGVSRAAEFLDACLHLSEVPPHPVAAGDVHLFHTTATVYVPSRMSISFAGRAAELQFVPDLESLNFQELRPGTVLAERQPGAHARLEVRNERGQDVTADYLHQTGSQIRLRRPVTPSMLTSNEAIVRQDCLGYFMEPYPLPGTSPLPG